MSINRNKAAEPEPLPEGFTPPGWWWKYLAACLDPEVAPTFSARCKASGIARTTLVAARKKGQFITWLQQQMASAVGEESGEIRRALFRRALKGDLDAIELWHRLYEDYVPAQRNIFEGDPSKIRELSDQQLDAMLMAGKGAAGEGTQVH
jgi:hypothetical protein